MIAVTHPGMIGDALWAIPAARALAARHGCQVDFWTSKLVSPARDLIEAQSFVRRCVVDHDYRIERTDCGVQPWRMEYADDPAHGYEKVYHLGFRETPDVSIPEYICRLAELGQQSNHFDVPENLVMAPVPNRPYIALAAKGETTFKQLFQQVAERTTFPVLEVGRPGEAVCGEFSYDMTSAGFLNMAYVISRCQWFVGLMSAPLVVASGFGCTKIVPHDGRSWDMRHVVRTGAHHYVAGYDPEAVLRHIVL